MEVSWPTAVESDPKAPFSIATTPRCGGGRMGVQLIWLLLSDTDFFSSHSILIFCFFFFFWSLKAAKNY